MARALDIEAEDIRDRMKILNARGLGISGPKGIELIGNLATEWGAEVIAFDPLYKVTEGDENTTKDVKPILQAFDALAERSGAAIMYVHHDPKGWVGERDIRDRGAGSNSLGRDYDACIALTPHASEPTAIVVETLLRNYRPQEPFTALWDADDETGGYRFREGVEIAPTKRTSKTSSNANMTPIENYREDVLSLVRAKPMFFGEVIESLRRLPGVSRDKARDILRHFTVGPGAPLGVYECRRKGVHAKWVGFPDAISQLRDEK
jgi:hypothetical protein